MNICSKDPFSTMNSPTWCPPHYYHMKMGLIECRAEQTLQLVRDIAAIMMKYSVNEKNPYRLSGLCALCENSFVP